MAAKEVKFNGNIWIQEASVAYRREVEKVLALVSSTKAGQTLFRHINATTRKMLIQPYDPKVEDDAVNAYELGNVEADGAPLGYITGSKEVDFGPFGKHDLPTFGTGKGTAVDVHYHPATWREVNKRAGHIAPGDGPGEVLFHEMTHGLRDLAAKMQYKTEVDGEERMDSVEEFYAIMAANVYRSERGFRLLRADHWSSTKITGNLVYQSAYYEHYQPYIDKWFNEQRAFCLDMARISTKFNPFREAAVALKMMTGSAVSMRL